MQLSIKEIIKATGGQISGVSEDLLISQFSTDTRTLKAGDLYVALRGDNFDGHTFIDEAIKKGAVACLVSKVNQPGPFIQVKDPLRAFGDIAHYWRKKFKLPVVVITGSAGKTTTKEFVASILSTKGLVCKTQGNFNNLIGLPKTLFELNKSHQFAVIEIGMNAFKEIDRLAEIAEPTIGLITNVGRAHLEGVGSVEGVAKAKGELFDRMQSDSLVLVNNDDPFISKMPTKAKKITYALDNSADIRGRILNIDEDTMTVNVITPAWQSTFKLPFVGEYLVRNFIASVAVACSLNISSEHIQKAMDSLDFIKHRGEKIQLTEGRILIDDCYNANPEAMKAAFKAFQSRFPNRRKIAILGDIFELGNEANKLHEEVGSEAAAAGFDAIFALGERAEHYVKGFVLGSGKQALAFKDINVLNSELKKQLKPGDALLVKGSRGAKMERVVDFLKED